MIQAGGDSTQRSPSLPQVRLSATAACSARIGFEVLAVDSQSAAEGDIPYAPALASRAMPFKAGFPLQARADYKKPPSIHLVPAQQCARRPLIRCGRFPPAEAQREAFIRPHAATAEKRQRNGSSVLYSL